MTNLDAKRHIADESAFAVDSSEWSRREWFRLRDTAPDLQRAGESVQHIVPNIDDMQCDSYHWFYQGDPKISTQDLSDDALASGLILNHMSGLEEYKRLRTHTVRNQPASTVAVRKIKTLVENLPEDVQDKITEQQNAQNEENEAKRELETLRDMWRDLDEKEENDRDETAEESDEGEEEQEGQEDDAEESEESGEGEEESEAGEGEGEGTDGTPGPGNAGGSGSGSAQQRLIEQGKKAAQRLEDAQSKAQQASQDLKEAFGENNDDVRGAVRQAMSEGNKEIEDMEEAMDAFSCGKGSRNDTQVSLEDQMEIAQMMEHDYELQTIARMAGRIERIVKKAKKDKVATMGGGSIVDIETTGDISRLVPGELVRFGNPVMKQDLMMRLTEKQALGYKKENKENVGKGPIICCVDNSGSMSSCGYYDEASPIIWAKAVALALYRECAGRERPFIYVAFSCGEDGLDVQRFEAKPGEEIDFMKFSQIFHAGGTDYQLALDACLEQFEEEGMEKADVIFISDGEYPEDEEMGNEFREQMEKLGGKTLGIQIGGYETEKPFGDFADASWTLDTNDVRKTGKDVPVLKEMFADYL
jgi:uncharacterized protein with von Willebrand factor type A (vWA) domain